ncbi:MAG: AAA family ATPase, partial [bacterium]
MNKKDIFKEIIRSFHKKPPLAVKKRALQLPFNSGKVITVSGVRRCGKTFLLLDAISGLIARGVELSRIVYINFEDERLETDKKDRTLSCRPTRNFIPKRNYPEPASFLTRSRMWTGGRNSSGASMIPFQRTFLSPA